MIFFAFCIVCISTIGREDVISSLYILMFSKLSKKIHQTSYIHFVVVIHANTEFFTLNSVVIRENTGWREIVFQRILCSVKRSFFMSGKKAGIATLFKLLNPKMLYTHCYGHALNLQSLTKFMKQCQEIKQNWTGQENFEICFCVIFDH